MNKNTSERKFAFGRSAVMEKKERIECPVYTFNKKYRKNFHIHSPVVGIYDEIVRNKKKNHSGTISETEAKKAFLEAIRRVERGLKGDMKFYPDSKRSVSTGLHSKRLKEAKTLAEKMGWTDGE